MSSNLKVNNILPSTGTTVAVSGIASVTSSVSIASSCTATTFYGSGANLTGISGVSVANQADNRLITATGTTDALNGESSLTFDGSKLSVNATSSTAGNLVVKSADSSSNQVWIVGRSSDNTGSVSFRNNGDSAYTGRIEVEDTSGMIFQVGSSERIRIDTSGSLLIANTTGSRTNLSNNADDIVIGNTSTSNETGISIFSTNTSGIRFNDASGTDAAIEYSHSARELRFNSAGNNRLQFGINASNSPVFSLGTGHYSGDSNNHNKGDRASVKVGGYLHLESGLGAAHNSRAGLGYNCYFHSLESFYCGTKSPSSGDNRPAAYGMAYGNHYFYSDASNTAHSPQASLTMTKNMVIHRSGHVTKPNQPSFLVAPANNGQTANGYGVYTTVFHNTGNHYNTSNGRFTAPVTGYYTFGANYVGDAGCENVFVRFYINGAYNQRGQHYSGGGNAWGSGSPYMSCDLSGTHTLLQAGDYVNLHLAASGATQGQSPYMRWYGYLVH